MTRIGADASSGLPQSQTSHVKLKVGTELLAGVKGLTRHGLIVSVGSDSFLLNVTSGFQDAKSLTLKVAERINNTNHKVQILASDGRQLAKPIQGELAARAQAPKTQPAPPTITEGHQIEVNARPVASDGRHLGAPVTVRLATTLATASGSNGAEARLSSEATIASGLADKPTIGKQVQGSLSSRSASPPLVQHASYPQAAEPSGPNLVPKTGLPLSSSSAQTSPATSPQQLSSVTTNSTTPADIDLRSTRPVSAASDGFPSSSYPSLVRASKHAISSKMLDPQPLAQNGERQELMQATVIGRAPGSGQLLLQAGDNLLLKVEQPIDLPIGSTLQMTLVAGSAGLAQPEELSPPNHQADLLGKLVALLEDIEQTSSTTVEHREPAGRRQLPMPDRQMASSLLALLGLQSGADLEEAGMNAYQQESADFSKTDQLKSLLIDIAKSANDSLAEGWRSTALPLGSDSEQALMIHWRENHLDHQSNGDQADAKEVTAQRAVFDISFSRLGRCQIDAFCQERRFDLLVRSEQPFDRKDQEEITGLFSTACEIAGLSGEIGYRHGQFVEPAMISRSAKTVTT